MTEAPPLIVAIQYVGVVAFAVSAALLGAQKRMNVVGVVVMGAIVSVAGGSLRDILLGVLPVFWVMDPTFVVVGVIAALAVIPLSRRGAMSVIRQYRLVSVADAAGLAAFVMVGTSTALVAGAGEFAAVLVGTIAGIGGGIIRDLLADEVPAVLRDGRLYASAAVVGAALYVMLLRLDAPEALAVWLPILVVFGVRMSSIVFGLRVPTVDLEGDRDSDDSTRGVRRFGEQDEPKR